MTYRSKYVGRYSGIGSMLQKPWMIRAVTTPAHEMKGIAEATAPMGRFPEDPHPGLYRSSFEVRYGVKNVPFRGKPRMRVAARLVNTAPHARIVEYGNGKTPRYAVLSRAIDTMKAAHGA